MTTDSKVDLSGRVAFFSLFSKEDKAHGLIGARRLAARGVKILSAGGTCTFFNEGGVPTIDLKAMTGTGAGFGHKMLTKGRELGQAMLSDMFNPAELTELAAANGFFVDMAFYTFYDIKAAIIRAASAPNKYAAAAIVAAATDMGGPGGTRDSAKGLRAVACRLQEMDLIVDAFEKFGEISVDMRQELRARAEFEVLKYVGLSVSFQGNGKYHLIAGEQFGGTCKAENGPQSPATLYTNCSEDPLAFDKFSVIEGIAPSFNNWCDIGDRLVQTMTHIAAGWKANYGHVPCIAVGSKHGNPCGTAVAVNDIKMGTARDMVKGDGRALFGGVVVLNVEVDGLLAEMMAQSMPDGKARFDCVIAPNFTDEAIKVLARAKGKCRLMVNPALLGESSALMDTAQRFVYLRGGYMTQGNYTFILNFKDPEMKVYGMPNGVRSPDIERDLLIAWAIGCTSNSNTVTIVRDQMLIGNGTGRQDRVGAAELAVKIAIDAGHGTVVNEFETATDAVRRMVALDRRAKRKLNYALIAETAVRSAAWALRKNRLIGSRAYSDSFFPFPDAVEVLIEAGVDAIFSTTGSQNDKIIQDLCQAKGVVLYQLPDSKARGFAFHG